MSKKKGSRVQGLKKSRGQRGLRGIGISVRFT